MTAPTSEEMGRFIGVVLVVLFLVLACAPILWAIVHSYRWALS